MARRLAHCFGYGAKLDTIALGAWKPNLLLLLSGLATYGFQYASFFTTRRLVDFHPVKLLFYPLVAIVAACCILRALILHHRGRILWRGRKINVRGQT